MSESPGELLDSAAASTTQPSDITDAEKIACIVCLADLANTTADLATGDCASLIARLVPCNHAMHNTCLAPWVERANSCPICRQNFNKVRLSGTLSGTIVDEYDVEDRIQKPDVEQNFLPNDMFDEEEPAAPCLLCNVADNEDVLLLCDSCDGPFHTYCCGLDEVPAGVWYCPLCMALDDAPTNVGSVAQRRGRARPRRRTQRNESMASSVRRNDDSQGGWARVWQEVWNNLNHDLDSVQPEQEAEEAWSRRAEIAQAQGVGYDGFRGVVASMKLSRPREYIPMDDAPTPEAVAAWSAFDEVKRLEKSEQRKRTSSLVHSIPPIDIAESSQDGERKRKRPRTRPSSNFVQPTANREQITADLSTPTVIGSWLNKLEGHNINGPDLGASTSSSAPTLLSLSPTRKSCLSPINSQHNAPPNSPPWSRPHSPLAPSPPPSANLHPHRLSNAPSSPITASRHQKPLSPEHSPSTSPTRPAITLPMKCKEEIASVVRAALQPHYRSKKVNTEQYTEINKKVSRHLYNVVGVPENGFSPSCIESEDKERLFLLAKEEVLSALDALHCH
ncbi:putative PHD and RING finger domain protein [Peziza echinospora]|nr:putative PHD and RING finger domain protein [Peziza echinospora]